jgi:peroxin-19
MTDQNDMDAILDAALDELDDDEEEEDEQTQQRPRPSKSMSVNDASEQVRLNQDINPSPPKTKDVMSAAPPDSNVAESEEESKQELFQTMLRDFIESEDAGGDEDEFLGDFMQQVQSRLSTNGSKPTSSSKNTKPKKKSPQKRTKPNTDANVDETISALLEDMAKASMGDSGIPDEGELLKGMIQQFQNAGEESSGEFNSDAMIDGMMEQLLSKDLMYEPMKQVTGKFPKWLKDNQGTLTPEEHQQRRKQYECFQKLVNVYETNPQNVKELLELMQQVQEYGQPPQDIINEIAPGLELDEDGMPKVNPMGGMPFGGNEECRIM